MRHDPERRRRRDPRGPRGGSGSGAERSPVVPRGGRISQPGRPAAPLGRGALPAPYCPSYPNSVPFRGLPWRLRASSEAFPASYAPAAGEVWVAYQRSKVRRFGSPGESRGCSIPPACSPERAASRLGPGGLRRPCSTLSLLTLPPSVPAGWRVLEFSPRRRTAEQAHGKLRGVRPG